MADLHSKILDVRPPPRGSKFFQFHAVLGEIWQNRMLVPPPPPPGELALLPRAGGACVAGETATVADGSCLY